MKIEKEDFDNWLESPITEKYIAFIKYQIEVRKEAMVEGSCLTAEGFEKIGQIYWAHREIISMYESMLNDLQYEVICPTEEETEDGSNSEESAWGQSTD